MRGNSLEIGDHDADDLIDEVSLLVALVAEGSEGPTLFTRGAPEARPMALVSVYRLGCPNRIGGAKTALVFVLVQAAAKAAGR